MKIEDGESVKIGSLNYEDCFEYQGKFFTVVDNAKVKIDWTPGVVVLVLCLNNNKLSEFYSDTKVKLIKLKIIME